MIPEDALDELRAICREARPISDGPLQLIHMVGLQLVVNGNQIVVPEALLCLTPHEGYPTRLFLSERPAKDLNWSIITVLGKCWHKWSWQGVHGNQRPVQVVAQILKAFR
jgi:hypothetical protein